MQEIKRTQEAQEIIDTIKSRILNKQTKPSYSNAIIFDIKILEYDRFCDNIESSAGLRDKVAFSVRITPYAITQRNVREHIVEMISLNSKAIISYQGTSGDYYKTAHCECCNDSCDEIFVNRELYSIKYPNGNTIEQQTLPLIWHHFSNPIDRVCVTEYITYLYEKHNSASQYSLQKFMKDNIDQNGTVYTLNGLIDCLNLGNKESEIKEKFCSKIPQLLCNDTKNCISVQDAIKLSPQILDLSHSAETLIAKGLTKSQENEDIERLTNYEKEYQLKR